MAQGNKFKPCVSQVERAFSLLLTLGISSWSKHEKVNKPIPDLFLDGRIFNTYAFYYMQL